MARLDSVFLSSQGKTYRDQAALHLKNASRLLDTASDILMNENALQGIGTEFLDEKLEGFGEQLKKTIAKIDRID